MSSSWDKKSILVIAFGLFLFVLYKAGNIALTWDEIYTFEQYVYPAILWDSSFNLMSANNHLLNTFLSIICTKTFGMHEWAYRLPNVLAFLLFLWANFRLCKMLETPIFRLSIFLLLTCNAYVVDFFSIARGYGLSIAFLSASFLYLLGWMNEKRKPHRLWFSLIFAAFAVLSHFTLFYYFVALYIVLLIHLLKESSKSQLILFALFGLCFTAFVLFYTHVLKEANALFYGGIVGFYHDTLNSIIYSFWHGTGYSYSSQLLLKIFVLIVFILTTLFVFKRFYKVKLLALSEPIAVAILLLSLSILLTQLAHYFISAKFLLQRTALFLIPLFNFVLFAWSMKFEKNTMFQKTILLLTILACFHFLIAVRMNSVFEWYLAESEGIRIESLLQHAVK